MSSFGTATKSPRNPHPETSAPVVDLDLEAQIVLAEKAVIARDDRIRRRADDITHRLKRDVLRHAGSGVMIGASTIALAWWLNRRRSSKASVSTPPGAPSDPGTAEHLLRDAGLSLAALLPLIWPLMPRHFRRGISPGMAGSLISFVAPLFARLFRRRTASRSAR